MADFDPFADFGPPAASTSVPGSTGVSPQKSSQSVGPPATGAFDPFDPFAAPSATVDAPEAPSTAPNVSSEGGAADGDAPKPTPDDDFDDFGDFGGGAPAVADPVNSGSVDPSAATAAVVAPPPVQGDDDGFGDVGRVVDVHDDATAAPVAAQPVVAQPAHEEVPPPAAAADDEADDFGSLAAQPPTGQQAVAAADDEARAEAVSESRADEPSSGVANRDAAGDDNGDPDDDFDDFGPPAVVSASNAPTADAPQVHHADPHSTAELMGATDPATDSAALVAGDVADDENETMETPSAPLRSVDDQDEVGSQHDEDADEAAAAPRPIPVTLVEESNASDDAHASDEEFDDFAAVDSAPVAALDSAPVAASSGSIPRTDGDEEHPGDVAPPTDASSEAEVPAGTSRDEAVVAEDDAPGADDEDFGDFAEDNGPAADAPAMTSDQPPASTASVPPQSVNVAEPEPTDVSDENDEFGAFTSGDAPAAADDVPPPDAPSGAGDPPVAVAAQAVVVDDAEEEEDDFGDFTSGEQQVPAPPVVTADEPPTAVAAPDPLPATPAVEDQEEDDFGDFETDAPPAATGAQHTSDPSVDPNAAPQQVSAANADEGDDDFGDFEEQQAPSPPHTGPSPAEAGRADVAAAAAHHHVTSARMDVSASAAPLATSWALEVVCGDGAIRDVELPSTAQLPAWATAGGTRAPGSDGDRGQSALDVLARYRREAAPELSKHMYPAPSMDGFVDQCFGGTGASSPGDPSSSPHASSSAAAFGSFVDAAMSGDGDDDSLPAGDAFRLVSLPPVQVGAVLSVNDFQPLGILED